MERDGPHTALRTNHGASFTTLGAGVKGNDEETDVNTVDEVAYELPTPDLNCGQRAQEIEETSNSFVARFAAKTSSLTLQVPNDGELEDGRAVSLGVVHDVRLAASDARQLVAVYPRHAERRPINERGLPGQPRLKMRHLFQDFWRLWKRREELGFVHKGHVETRFLPGQPSAVDDTEIFAALDGFEQTARRSGRQERGSS